MTYLTGHQPPTGDRLLEILEQVWARLRHPVLPALEAGAWLVAILMTFARELAGRDQDGDRKP